MSPGRRPSRNGNPPRRAASHTSAPTAASAAPAKTVIRPSSRIGSIDFHSTEFAGNATTSEEGRSRDSARSLCFRRACARCGRTGPVISTVFAQYAANKKDEWKNNLLNGSWRQRNRLCVPMPPQHVGQIKDRRPTGRIGIQNRKQRLEVAIQVTRRNGPAAQLQEIVPGVPPGMNNPGGKGCGPPCRHNDLFLSESGSE